jgi:hypothetical protein
MKWRVIQMLKKIGVPLLALLGVLAMAPHKAKAAVGFGVSVGTPPYTYPAYPAYPNYPPYPDYQGYAAYPPNYYAAPYAYIGPNYVPYGGWGWYEDHDRWEHRGHEFREHAGRERGGFRGGRR